MIRFFLFIALLATQSFGDVRSDGNSLANTTLQTYGGGNLVNSLGNPLVSGTRMTAMNGTQFDAKMMCSGSSQTPFVSMSLTAGSGDGSLWVQMDKDLNGVKESFWTFEGISGVCTNGAIQCSAGTWSNCTFKKWQFSAGNLFLATVNNYEVGGCFCTNGSCGNLITTNHDYILDILGSGISSVVSGSSPNYVISNRSITDGKLEMWAQRTDCVNPQGTTPPAFNEQDDSQILSSTATLQSQQLASNSGEYSLLTNSIDSQNNELTTKNCQIRNEPGFNGSGVLTNSHTDTCGVYAADATCRLKDEIVYDKTNYSVNTVKDYGITGIHPMASCTSMTNGGIDYTVCADGSAITYYAAAGATATLYSNPLAWWKIERHYVCDAPQNNDFTAMKQRSATAKDTASWNGSALSYTNTYQDANGNWVSENSSTSIATFGSPQAKYCEVEFIAQSNDVFSDTTQREDQNNNATVKKVEIRECTNDWTVCPTRTGETVKHVCGDINDFSETASALTSVSESTKDMVCSTN